MASVAPRVNFGSLILEPLRGVPLAACALLVWIAGAIYCMGYERLLSGFGHFPGSLTWSAVAVLPWFALFEWAKQPQGMEATRRPATLLLLVVLVALASVLLEYLVNMSLGEATDRLGLLLMRRLPAIGAALLLILLTRKAITSARLSPATAELSRIADMVDFVVAADNYVELHIHGKVTLRRLTLTDAALALEHHGFVRVHRRYLVNRAKVAGVSNRVVRLKSGSEIPIGQAFAANVRSLA